MVLRRIALVIALSSSVIGCVPEDSRTPADEYEPPEPTFVVKDGLFHYAVAGAVNACARVSGAKDHEIVIGGIAVHAWTPPVWTSSYAGTAMWLTFDDAANARIVIYPIGDPRVEIAQWHARDVVTPGEVTGSVVGLDSPRQPFMYRYRSTSDNRAGVVYALRTADGKAVLVHGLWSADLDRTLLPVAFSVANCVELRSAK